MISLYPGNSRDHFDCENNNPYLLAVQIIVDLKMISTLVQVINVVFVDGWLEDQAQDSLCWQHVVN